MQSTRRVAAPAAAAVVAVAGVIARLRSGRTEEKRDLGALRTDGTKEVRMAVDGESERREESGAERTGLISHLGVTRRRRRRLRQRNDGAFSILYTLSLSLSLSFFLSFSLPETNE